MGGVYVIIVLTFLYRYIYLLCEIFQSFYVFLIIRRSLFSKSRVLYIHTHTHTYNMKAVHYSTVVCML